MDLMHAVPFARTARVWSGRIEECRGAAVTVISAGAAQKPGETRIDLVQKNAAILRDLVPKVAEANPGGNIVIASNPVDVLSYLAWRIRACRRRASSAPGRSSIPRASDAARRLLRRGPAVGPRTQRGEHGDSEVPCGRRPTSRACRSRTTASPPASGTTRGAGRHLRGHPRRGLPDHRAQGRDVLRGRGRPRAAGQAILRDQHTVLSVSSLIGDTTASTTLPVAAHGRRREGVGASSGSDCRRRRRRVSGVRQPCCVR